MYTILVVEENTKILEHIAALIYQNFPKVKLIATTENHCDALSLAKMHQPNIMIINIDSIYIDGYGLLDKIRNQTNTRECIVLSKFHHFESIQKALQMGVQDYLTKPIVEKAVLNAVEKCIREIEIHKEDISINVKKRLAPLKPSLDGVILFTLITNGDFDCVDRIFHAYGIRVQEIFFAVMSVNAPKSQVEDVFDRFVNANFKVITGIMFEYYIFLIIAERKITKEVTANVEKIKSSINKQGFILGVGTAKKNIEDYYLSYKEAMNEVKEIEAKEKILKDMQLVAFQVYDIKCSSKRVFKYSVLGNRDGMKLEVQYLVLFMYEVSTEKSEQILTTFLKFYCAHLECSLDIDKQISTITCGLQSRHLFTELCGEILCLLDSMMEEVSLKYNQTSAYIVKNAISYIKKNYVKPLILEHVASYLKISSYYLCKLFHDYLKTSFIDELNECRIDAAKKLLLSDKRIKNIAYEVGYKSSTYFGRVFKASTNMTAKEYRMKFKSYYDVLEYIQESSSANRN